MTLTSIPTIQPPFELGKHMAKLSVIDSEDAVILLRPRYAGTPEQTARMIRGIGQWKESNHVKLRVLVVPHNFDVFALEVNDGGQEEQQADRPGARGYEEGGAAPRGTEAGSTGEGPCVGSEQGQRVLHQDADATPEPVEPVK